MTTSIYDLPVGGGAQHGAGRTSWTACRQVALDVLADVPYAMPGNVTAVLADPAVAGGGRKVSWAAGPRRI